MAAYHGAKWDRIETHGGHACKDRVQVDQELDRELDRHQAESV